MCVCAGVYAYVCECMQVYAHPHVYTSVFVCVRLSGYLCLRLCACIFTFAPLYVYFWVLITYVILVGFIIYLYLVCAWCILYSVFYFSIFFIFDVCIFLGFVNNVVVLISMFWFYVRFVWLGIICYNFVCCGCCGERVSFAFRFCVIMVICMFGFECF